MLRMSSCLANQRLFKLVDENASVLDTFRLPTTSWPKGACLWRLLVHKGLIEIHFEDVCSLIRDGRSSSVFAVGTMGPYPFARSDGSAAAHPMR
jgi:hypothetical protein